MQSQPAPRFAIARADRRDELPVSRRMVEPVQVHELVQKHVIAHPVRHRDESPVEGDVSVAPARAPSRPLVADADARHRQPVVGGKGEQPCRQFCLRTCPQRLTLLRRERGWPQPCPLLLEPRPLAREERIGLATRPAARDGDTHAAVAVQPQQIAPCPWMPDERDQCRGRRRHLKGEWQLHDADRTAGCPPGRQPRAAVGADRPGSGQMMTKPGVISCDGTFASSMVGLLRISSRVMLT